MLSTIVTTVSLVIAFIIRWYWVNRDEKDILNKVQKNDAEILKKQRDNNVNNVDDAERMYDKLREKYKD